MTTTICAIRDAEVMVARIMRELGPSEALDRYVSRYAKVRTQKAYLMHIQLYLRWLKGEGKDFTPDGLVQDNLNCVFGALPQDVATKRKHTDWLNRYVNIYLMREGRKEAHRRLAFSAIREFYKKNDSPLFGDIGVSSGPAEPPAQALPPEDIRKVLKVLPLNVRLPLIMEWQSAMEINRVLGLRWKDVEGAWRGERPLRLDLFGRKKHRKPYHTFLGRDSVELLKVWKEKWKSWTGREPMPEELIFLSKRGKPLTPKCVNSNFKETAMRLARQGLVSRSDPASWHSHALRHSFKTQGEHARVPSDLVELWMGHDGGIRRVYDNRDQVHMEDFVRAYAKLEPFVSLDQTETTLREEYEDRERTLLRRLSALEEKISRWTAQEAPSIP
jgi:integrase